MTLAEGLARLAMVLARCLHPSSYLDEQEQIARILQKKEGLPPTPLQSKATEKY